MPAKSEAERLSAMLWDLRDKLKFDLPDPAKAVSRAMASKELPVTLLDTGDNLGVGLQVTALSYSRSW